MLETQSDRSVLQRSGVVELQQPAAVALFWQNVVIACVHSDDKAVPEGKLHRWLIKLQSVAFWNGQA